MSDDQTKVRFLRTELALQVKSSTALSSNGAGKLVLAKLHRTSFALNSHFVDTRPR